MVLFVRVSVPSLRMPPPRLALLPLATFRLDILAIAVLVISNTREALFPLMVMLPTGPTIVRFLEIRSSPVVSVMVWPLRAGLKEIVSPGAASAIA